MSLLCASGTGVLGRGFRMIMLMLVLAGCLGPGGASALAGRPGDGPAARLFSASLEQDLASMTLAADEFPEAGLRLERGSLFSDEAFAAGKEGLSARTYDELLEQMDEVGWQARYQSDFYRIEETDPSLYAVWAQSTITIYADEDGAAEGFGLFDFTSELPGAREVDAPAAGDQSRLIRLKGVLDGQPYTRIEYTFRMDRIVASVNIFWFRSDDTDLATPEEMAASAGVMVERIETVLDSPEQGLFQKHLRLVPTATTDVEAVAEHYVIRDGAVVPLAGVDEDVFGSISGFWIEQGVSDLYYSLWRVSPEAYPEDVTTIILRVYELETPEDARAFVDAMSRFTVEFAGDAGYASMEPLDDPRLDGIAAGTSYVLPMNDGGEGHGYHLWLQEGRYVVNMAADSPYGVDLETMTSMVERQATCVASERVCRPIQAMKELSN